MPLRSNFTMGNVVNPADGAIKALSNVGTIMQQQEDIKTRRLKQADDAARLAIVQQQATRATTAYDLAQAQRKVEADIFNLDNSVSPVAAAVNDQYSALNKKWEKLVPGGADMDKYTAELDALNKSAIYDHFGGNAEGTTTVGENANKYFHGRDDALATKDALMKKIMASKAYTGAEADALATRELTRRFPLASAASIKNAQAMEKTVYEAGNAADIQLMKEWGKAGNVGGLTVTNSDGSTSIIGGGFTQTNSYNNNYKHIQTVMEGEDLPTTGFWNGMGNWIRGQDTATKHNVAQAASNLMKFDSSIDANAAIASVVSNIQKNYLTGNSIAEPSLANTQKLVKDAKKIGNTSGRTRTKGGSIDSVARQEELEAIKTRMTTRTDDYRDRNAILAASGMHQGATQAMYERERPPTTTVSKIFKNDELEKAHNKIIELEKAHNKMIEQEKIAKEQIIAENKRIAENEESTKTPSNSDWFNHLYKSEDTPSIGIDDYRNLDTNKNLYNLKPESSNDPLEQQVDMQIIVEKALKIPDASALSAEEIVIALNKKAEGNNGLLSPDDQEARVYYSNQAKSFNNTLRRSLLGTKAALLEGVNLPVSAISYAASLLEENGVLGDGYSSGGIGQLDRDIDFARGEVKKELMARTGLSEGQYTAALFAAGIAGSGGPKAVSVLSTKAKELVKLLKQITNYGSR